MNAKRLSRIRELLSLPPNGRWSRWRHDRAIKALIQDDSTEAREVLCRGALWEEHDLAREVALAKSWGPDDPAERALYYLLTGQTEKYEALDFDRSLLQSIKSALSEKLRCRLAGRIRALARPDLVRVLCQPGNTRQVGQMTNQEWEAVEAVLLKQAADEDLWSLVFEAPLQHSVRLLCRLRERGWKPRDQAEQSLFRALCALLPAGAASRVFPTEAHELLPNRCPRSYEYAVHAPLVSVSFSPGGSWLGAAGDLETVIWNLDTGNHYSMNEQRQRGEPAGERSLCAQVAFSEDGRWAATSNSDVTVRLWDLKACRCHSILRHTEKLDAVAFARDSRWLATGSLRSVLLWDVTTGKMLRKFELSFKDFCPRNLAFSPDGHWLAASIPGGLNTRGGVRVWNLMNGKLHLQMVQENYALAFSPEGGWLATGEQDDAALWDVATGKKAFTLADSTKSGWRPSVYGLAFSPDGRWLATANTNGCAQVWSVSTGSQHANLKHGGVLTAVRFSSDSRWLASASRHKTVRLWNADSRTQLAILDAHDDTVCDAAISPDGRWLATGSHDMTAKLWPVPMLLPLGMLCPADLAWAESAARSSPIYRTHLQLLAALLRYKFRFDVSITESAQRVLSEFDIGISNS